MSEGIIGQDTRLLCMIDGVVAESLSTMVTNVRVQFDIELSKRPMLGTAFPAQATSYNGASGTMSGIQRNTDLDLALARVVRDIIRRQRTLRWNLMTLISPPGGERGYWLLPNILWSSISMDISGKSEFRSHEMGFSVLGEPTFVLQP